MATQEPETSEPSDRSQPTEQTEDHQKGADIVPLADAVIQIDSMTSGLASGQPPNASDPGSQAQDATLVDTDQDTSPKDASSTSEDDKSHFKHGAMISPNSKLVTPMGGGDTATPPVFTFSKLDRRNLELGGKREDFQHVAPRNHGSPVKPSPASDEAQDTNPEAVTHTSPLGAIASVDKEPQCSARATLHEPDHSDVVTDIYSEPALSQPVESVQCQLDQQIYQEASMSDEIQHSSSPATQSEDVIYMGANRPLFSEHPLSGPAIDETQLHVTQQHLYLPQEINTRFATASSNLRGYGKPSLAAPIHTRGPSARIVGHHPVPQAKFQVQGSTNVPAPSQSGIQELLEVVEYKFKQNEQKLRQAFLAESNNSQRELKQAYEDNEELHFRITALEDRCNSSEAAVVKYKTQLGKAKGLQKFLDGLGSDLHTLKRSYDAERSAFAERIETSETEISRLESTLAGKNEFESMLSHSKTSLERLLEAKNFELQSLVQHRDMLRIQLDERIGQLVEERDARLKLEQLVAQLRVGERTSLTTSIEQCAASLASKFEEFHRQDDQLVVGIVELQHAVKTLTEQSSVTPNDCEAIKSEIQALGLRIAQSLSVEATNNTTVAEVSSAVEGIIQAHMQTFCHSLDRHASASAQTVVDASTQVALRVELQSMVDRLEHAENQLESASQCKASMEKSLSQSTARVAELEAASTIAADANTQQITPEGVENKINEAVADARKQISISANVLVAQEKSRYSNELKKVENERRKALEKSQLQKEEITNLQSKLEEMQMSTKATADRTSTQQLDALIDNFRALEEKHHTLQLEFDKKRSLEPRLAAMSAERDAVKTIISTCETKIKALTRDIDRRNSDLLQAQSSEERVRVELEGLRNQHLSEIDGMRRKLSQAEEKTKDAEAGLVQMESSAEKTIREEQERHRKQQEALQQRLDEAQSELQTKSEEADNHRAFVERTVTQQQAVWQRLNADLETKASDVKAQLDETNRLLRVAQEEQNNLQTTIASLKAEIQQHHKSETGYRSREDVSRAAMDRLRQQLDAAQTEITSLQAVQQRYLREKDERSLREARAKSAYNTLRQDHEAITAVVADLKASEKQSKSDEAERKEREVDTQRQLDDMRNECDIAQATVKELNAKRSEMQIPNNVNADESHWVAPQPGSGGEFHIDDFAPPPIPEHSAIPKQRKRADRNTNTIIGSGFASRRAASQSIQSKALPTRAQVLIPAKPALDTTRTSSSHDEMLDVVSSQPEWETQTQLFDFRGSKKSTLSGHTGIPQAFATSLDFSGKPLIATNEPFAEKIQALGPSRSDSGSDFKIHENSQNSLNEGIDENSSVCANFTFRKPFSLPNSGSKRLKRTASDKSLGGHSASSRGTRRTRENLDGLSDQQANEMLEVSAYPYGSSPEFMNPPSTMTKRRYSGGPATPGQLESHMSRRQSTPLPDPRLVKRTSGNKRVTAKDVQLEDDLEPPAKKKRATQSGPGSKSKPSNGDSPLGRSSQSVKDLPRMENLDAGRAGGQIQSSHMRTSAGSRRNTRSQKGSKGDTFQARFSQELRRQ